jgi:KDO2-lipid IV(A) lauroyltransferase
MSSPLRALKYRLEYAAVRALMGVLAVLPYAAAARVGAALGWLFALLPVSANAVARANIRKAFPQLTEPQVRALHTRAAVHTGMTMAEFVHVHALDDAGLAARVTLDGELPTTPTLFFGGHLGNWELVPAYSASRGLKMATVYRSANNRLVDAFIVARRSACGVIQIPKGSTGARQLLSVLGQGVNVGMLVDQKMNDGIPAPFFGHTVMTASALASLALKRQLPVRGAFCVRTGMGRYTLRVTPPLLLPKGPDHEANLSATVGLLNAALEEAIRAHPEQWFWFHKRFGKLTPQEDDRYAQL